MAFLSFPSSSLLLLLLLGVRVLLDVHRDGVLGDGVHGDGVHGDGSNDSLQQVVQGRTCSDPRIAEA